MIAHANPRVAPPVVVRSAFDTRFPNAAVKEWTERKEGQKDDYTVYFKFNGKKLYAYYKTDGTWEGKRNEIEYGPSLPLYPHL